MGVLQFQIQIVWSVHMVFDNKADFEFEDFFLKSFTCICFYKTINKSKDLQM